MSGEEYLELKFRLHDGTDIGPRRYLSATTVATLKESILAQWPKGCGRPQLEKNPRGQFDIELVAVGIFTFANHTFLKHLEKSKFCMTQNDLMTAEYKRAEKENGPKTINDVKLINSGKILENNKTLGECRGPICDLPGGVITMHVVLRPPSAEKGNEKQPSDMPKDNKCSCTIL